MAWLGEVIDGAPEVVRAEYDRLVQLLGPDFPLADLIQRSGDGEPVYVAGARVSPEGAEAVIELFVRPGFLSVALAENEAKALAKALKNGIRRPDQHVHRCRHARVGQRPPRYQTCV
jgi:hypothetical protein